MLDDTTQKIKQFSREAWRAIKSFRPDKEEYRQAIERVSKAPVTAAGSFILGDDIWRQTSVFSGDIRGPQDAYRHILWASKTRQWAETVSVFENPEEIDKKVADVLLAHEDSGNSRGQTPDEEEMDKYNNKLGIKLGRKAVEEKWSDERLDQEIYNSVKNNDGTGKNNTPFWYDKSDPKRKPPGASDQKPLSVREELEKNYRVEKQKAEAANQNAVNSNNPPAKTNKAPGGGTVQVHAYDRESGAEHVRAHTRRPPGE